MDRYREMSFEQEAFFYEKEAREILARQKAGCDDSEISGIARHGMRVIAKAREVISKMETTTQNGVAEKSSDAEVDIAENATTTPKWIPVTERLPEDDTDVLAYQNRGDESRIVPANYGRGVWFDGCFNCEADHLTHWMPLPQPPKEGE